MKNIILRCLKFIVRLGLYSCLVLPNLLLVSAVNAQGLYPGHIKPKFIIKAPILKDGQILKPKDIFRDCYNCPEMVVIGPGTGLVGSKKFKSEMPQRRIKFPVPFAIGRFETLHSEWRACVEDNGCKHKPHDHEWGEERMPVININFGMVQNYIRWLSKKTGKKYRLPSEAEWEYACRAGTKTAYSFGDSEKELNDYAWFIDNADFKYQKVGKKKPNPWGIHDMHGNVAEWTIDIFSKEGYDPERLDNPWAKGRDLYPRVARGGSWNDFPESLRSSARFPSTKSWKLQDPQLPKSIWYLTDAQWLGFRIVRPLIVPSAELMESIWNTGVNHDTLE